MTYNIYIYVYIQIFIYDLELETTNLIYQWTIDLSNHCDLCSSLAPKPGIWRYTMLEGKSPSNLQLPFLDVCSVSFGVGMKGQNVKELNYRGNHLKFSASLGLGK